MAIQTSAQETINTLDAIFERHRNDRICVLGTTCCGKTTLLRQIPGCVDLDDELWPQLTQEEADFISRAVRSANCWPTAAKRPYGCVAFGKNGEFAEKWLKKGMRIGIEGRIQTGTFTDKDGIKRKSFDIIVSKHHFCDSKDVSGAGEAPAAQNTGMKENTDGFYEIDEDMEDDDLPF